MQLPLRMAKSGHPPKMQVAPNTAHHVVLCHVLFCVMLCHVKWSMCMCCSASFRIPKTLVNFGNSWEFDLYHSKPGIGWEFVKFVHSGWE